MCSRVASGSRAGGNTPPGPRGGCCGPPTAAPPRLLPEHVADEVVLVQPLHDDDDAPSALVVEPAVEGVGVPIIGGIPSRLGERLLRLRWVITQAHVRAAP